MTARTPMIKRMVEPLGLNLEKIRLLSENHPFLGVGSLWKEDSGSFSFSSMLLLDDVLLHVKGDGDEDDRAFD